MALLQTCTYARITHTLRLAYAAHQVRRLMTGVRTSPSGLLDNWRTTATYYDTTQSIIGKGYRVAMPSGGLALV